MRWDRPPRVYRRFVDREKNRPKWPVIGNMRGLKNAIKDMTIDLESRWSRYIVVLAFAGGFFSVSHYIFTLIYSTQPTPYLDEVFHIPQATKYFRGLFNEWDPKITTLPGLYLISVGVLKPISLFIGEFSIVYALRLTNLAACFVNVYLLHRLQNKIDPPKKELKTFCWNLLSSLNMATLPVLYFFAFLYYTDMLSVMLILLMYTLHLEDCNLLAAGAGLVSVVVRQTNVIWVAFFAVQTASQVLKKEISAERKVSSYMQRSPRYFVLIFEYLQRVWSCGVTSVLKLALKVMGESWGYLAVCVAFVLFVYKNGSIVVGDKSAHKAVLHIPQIFYFSLFTSVFSFPYFLLKVKLFLKCVCQQKKFMLFMLLISCLVVSYNTLAHPYLLADNRHLSFYVWKRLYQRHELIKYAVLPVYLFGFFCMAQCLKHTPIIFRISYFFCVFSCLVPQELLEFRYFIIPYLLFRLHIIQRQGWQLLLEFLINGLINAAVVYLFLSKVFYWEDREEPQRILW